MRAIADEELRLLFKAEGEEHLAVLERGLLHLEQQPEDRTRLDELMRAAHSLKGAARVLGVGPVEAVAHHYEDVLRTVLQGVSLPLASFQRLHWGLDVLGQLVREAVTGEPSGVVVSEVLEQLRHPSAEPALPPPPPEPPPSHAVPSNDPQNITSPLPVIHPEPVQTLGGDRLEGRYQIETLRVDTHKLDLLMALAGELSVVKTRFEGHLATIERALSGYDELHRLNPSSRHLGWAMDATQSLWERLGQVLQTLRQAMFQDTTTLATLTEQMDERVQQLRLLPLNTVFELFHRLVRDLTQTLGKQARLVIEGGQTVADKRLIEEIKDPLMHLLRNALDHGIETPAERSRHGKPPTATLTLRGVRSANHILIEVADDGRGLDHARIRRQALKLKLGNEQDLGRWSQEALEELLFRPGFSTAVDARTKLTRRAR
ncbi:hypothetical protein CCP4SC76_5930008 [Gammaproteobacteria bacterium]